MLKDKNFIVALPDFIRYVEKDTSSWELHQTKGGCPWYRGQDREDGPTPRLFRGTGYEEFELTRMFRDRAGAFGSTLETTRLDKWLFLMQHYGAATRLLDWTESPLIALYFALDAYAKLPVAERSLRKPTVWILNPLKLNELSGISVFPNTWDPKIIEIKRNDETMQLNMNPALERFRLAFHPYEEWQHVINLDIVKLPIAVQTTYLDLRMYSQRSCFTIHGTDNTDIESLCERHSQESGALLLKYVISPEQSGALLEDLRSLGVNKATLFPDMEGIATELSDRFKKKKQ